MKRIVVIAVVLACVVGWYYFRGRFSDRTEEESNRRNSSPRESSHREDAGLATRLVAVDSSTQLRAGGGTYSVVFQDATLPPELKSFVLRDLQSTYGHLTTVKVSPPLKGKEAIKIGDKEIQIVGMANFQGIGAYFPRSLMGKFGMLATIDGANAMVVPNDLVDLYRPTFQAIKDDPEMFDRLGMFIDYLRELPFTHELLIFNP